MKGIIPSLSYLLPALMWAGDGWAKDEGEESAKAEAANAMKMLVEGSILKGIIIPQYGEDKHLASVLRAERLVLDDYETIRVNGVGLEFYHPDETLRGRVDLAEATLHDQRMLRSRDEVEILADDAMVRGTALVYDLAEARGFLHGPVDVTLPVKNFTVMNRTNDKFFGAASAVMAISMVGLNGAELPELGEAEIRGLDRLAVPSTLAFQTIAAEGEKKIEAGEEASRDVDQQLEKFLREVLPDVEVENKPDIRAEVPGPEINAEAKGMASIEASKGVFFDSQTGMLVFLEDVEVNHPEFSLTGADEVKVFFEKKEPKKNDNKEGEEKQKSAKKKDEGDKKEVGGIGEFGDPQRIIANGAVVVERKAQGDDRKVKASGRQMVMDLSSHELIIRGGQPWVVSDTANGRIVDPDGYIRINLKSGDASFVGKSKGFVATEN